MAIYSGSIYLNTGYSDLLTKFYDSSVIENYLFLSTSILIKDCILISDQQILKYDNDLTTININSQIIYYQRVFSSGLNNWSYYKTIGYIDSNPSSIDTIPPYSGSILSHEIVGILKQ